jgi:glycosyltransferase involved in cell wall biosynthesis
MRILVVNWQDRRNPAAGGAEQHLHRVFGELAARGHSVTLLVSRWRGAPARACLDGMEVHRAGSRRSFPFAAPLHYRRHLRSRAFDVVVEDLNKAPLWAPAWAGRPVLLLVHHLFGGASFRSFPLPVAATTWLAERPLARAYARVPVEAVSRSTASDLVERGFLPERIRVIPNGVDSDFFRPAGPAARAAGPTLAFVGRLQPYKRVDLVRRAVALASRLGVDLRLRVAGRGPAEPGLRRLARRLGIEDRVRFLGYIGQEEKRALLQAAWLHVLTSEKEGWGLSVMEAAACGTPTVGSSSPGLRDSVVHRETGILLPHGDWVDLGAQLVELVRSPERIARMGEAARRRAERFTWQRTVEETEQHLQQVTRDAGTRPRTLSPSDECAAVGGDATHPGRAARSTARSADRGDDP